MFKTVLAHDTWKSKYRYGNEKPLETFQRVAKALASVEKNPEEWYDKFLKTMVRFNSGGMPIGLKCTTGGRITANIGTSFKKATLVNCFISGPVTGATIEYTRKIDNGLIQYPVKYKTDESPDDLVNIFLTIMEQAKTLASEGGYGVNFDFIRPRGSLIKGTGIKHPGVVAYMKIWDAVSECIVQGDADGYVDKIKNHLKSEEKFQELQAIVKKSIRKGAMLAALSVSHPDAEEFIRAKQISGILTKFNISIILDDVFMEAVQNNTYYDQTFNGAVYKRIKARDLYDLIMKSTYNRAEPGVLFSDNMMKNNPIAYMGKLSCVNPCVRRGTLVATFNGLKPIEQVVRGELIQTTLGFEPVENIEIHENVNVYRITFSDGNHLDVSEGHIFHTQPGGGDNRKSWDNSVRLIDLSIGDFVRKDRYRFETENNSDFSRDKGLFAGLFLGDGHIDANNKVCISVDQRDDSSYIFDLCDRLNFSHWNDDSATDGFSRKIVIGGKGDNKSVDLLKDLGLDVELEAPQKNFPYWWLNTNKAFLRGVLDGLLSSDGNVNDTSRYPQIRFKSNSLALHENLRHLMLYFGADYKVYKGEKAGEEHKILGRIIKRNFDVFEGVIDNDSILSIYREVIYLSHPEKNKKLKEIVKSTSLTGVKWKTKIESIELVGTDTVYDLYAKDSDDWNTCGIVSRGCGEIPGLTSITTVCLLGSLNLTQYIKIGIEGSPYFDFEEYSEDVKIFMRMLDNVNDLTYAPLPSYQWVIDNLRQVGMGINGLGSTLAMLKIPYNSSEAVNFTKKVCEIKENLTWQTSAFLAKEKGTFSVYNKELFESTEYFKSNRISEETKNLIHKYGVRNAKTTTCPPLGNSSIISDITSNGVEPIFLFEYERKVVCQKWPEGLNSENVKEILKYHKEKDYEYWRGDYKGTTYYYEPHNRGLCEINVVRDYGYQWLLDNFPNEDHSEYLKTTQDLQIDDHLNVQEVVQYYNNQAVSKTCNIPNKYPFESFKDLYMRAWKCGLNGFTTYREGSMESVLSDISKAEKREIVKKDIKLPDVFINGSTHIIKREGKKFYLHFSYLPEDTKMEFPVVLWIYTNAHYKADELRICNKAAKKLSTLALNCGIDNKIVIETVEKATADYPHNRLGRMISLCLRHNIPREDILVSLMNIDGDNISTLLTSVRKFFSKTLPDGTKLKGLKCPECGEQLIMEAGCRRCPACPWSAC
jgi:ribonucleoside-diphosphate reductase alpha chain